MKSRTRGNSRIWILLGVAVVALTWSAAVGTQPVHASGSCTTSQCNAGYGYAIRTCASYGGVAGFECPVSGETDDFFFACKFQPANDGYFDCSSDAPS